MTRINDGAPPQSPKPETSAEGSATDDGTPVRRVLVSYDEFQKRGQLRRRVMAAFERIQGEHAPDGEFRAGTPAEDPGVDDEKP
jgi:hypothetical protein